jgi:hypothetical protein
MKRLEYRDTQDVQLACKLLSLLHQFPILHIQNLSHTEAVVVQDSESGNIRRRTAERIYLNMSATVNLLQARMRACWRVPERRVSPSVQNATLNLVFYMVR